MQILFILLPLAMIMAGVALAAFLWAVRQGQFDDLDTPQLRAIIDEAEERCPTGTVISDCTCSHMASFQKPPD